MDQTQKIPDPENFTKNIESTIDELFSASRQIEIDPLTSEVRELSQDKTDQRPSEQIEITTDEKILELDSGLELESAIDMKVPEVAHEVSEEPVSERLVENVNDLEPNFPEHPVLVNAVESHIKILNDCISYILPVEKLLAQTPGMEKLHHFQQNIKNMLEEQKKILEKALGTGDK
jgi:hypothetical protein